MKNSFDLQHKLTQLLIAEQAHLADINQINKLEMNEENKIDIYPVQKQISFYQRVIDELNEDKDTYNQIIKITYRLWETHKRIQPNFYPFMTVQLQDEKDNFTPEGIDADYIPPEIFEKRVEETKIAPEDADKPSIIIRYYSVNPTTTCLQLEKIYTFDKGVWKQGLALSKDQHTNLINKGGDPTHEVWRFWPLFSIKEIETIVATSKKYTCNLDALIESDKATQELMDVVDKVVDRTNQTIKESDQIMKEAENVIKLFKTSPPSSLKKYH